MASTNKSVPPLGGAGRRPSTNPPSSQSTPSRSPTRMTARTTASAGGVARTRSVRTSTSGGNTPISARSAVRKTAVGLSGAPNTKENGDVDKDIDEDDSMAQQAAAIQDLQERLQKAELASEEYQRQVAILQSRLDDAHNDQNKLEEGYHEHQTRAEELETEKKESTRLRRELESTHEQDRAAAAQEREVAQAREEELVDTVKRLKDTIAQRELRVGLEDDRRPASVRNSISPTPEAGQFAPSASLHRSDSQNSSRLVLQKDKIIESLRLELAEAQIKLVEVENLGGGQLQELERSLMETRVANARLMEENESFHLLLSEKTLNGDLLRPQSTTSERSTSRRDHSSSLADELGSTTDEDEDGHHRSQAEIATLKDQNKALTLYINNIITRLLEHSDFEAILDRNPNIMSGPDTSPSKPVQQDKALPPPPGENNGLNAPSILQRTKSMMVGRPQPRQTSPNRPGRPREPVAPGPSANENPETAPRIPLGRAGQRSTSGSHRHSTSEWAAAATVVNTIYRGPSPSRNSGQLSPGLSSQTGSSFFSSLPNSKPSNSRLPSGSSVPTVNENERLSSNRESKLSSGRNSVISDPENTRPSPPHSTTSSGEKPSGAIMGGKKMRPLRLVQEAAEQDEAARKANRTSWMGWFNKGTANAGKAPNENTPQQQPSLWPS